jgi:3-oxoacyl-[acyl-carrier protein] reductase
MSGARLTHLSRSVAGQVAIITGAGSGMGRATAHLFADEGALVAVVDRDPERVGAVVEEIATVHGGSSVQGFVADVTDAEAITNLADVVAAQAGRIDIVVNNAGVSLLNSVFQDDESYEANWALTLEINLTAQSRLIRAALRHMLLSGGGRVVNVASTESIVATAGLAAYAASKAGVVGLTKAMAVELGRHGITVNCVCPGPINTAMTAGIAPDAKELYAKRRVPMRRYGEPEEVAHAILNLCLPSSSFVTGAVVTVDGGMTVRHT